MRRPTPMHTILSMMARLGALLLLAAMFVAVPVAASAIVGGSSWSDPGGSSLADALRSGRLDDRAVLQCGVVLFLVLWVWFAVTAVAEVAQILAAGRRGRGARTLRPTNATPSGWVRHLVRIALLSSTAVMGSGVGMLGNGLPARAVASASPVGAHVADASRVSNEVPLAPSYALPSPRAT